MQSVGTLSEVPQGPGRRRDLVFQIMYSSWDVLLMGFPRVMLQVLGIMAKPALYIGKDEPLREIIWWIIILAQF